jgi:predicted Fe-Mo cluster-binding NifX family protein
MQGNKTMKVAVPCYHNRISPVFDTAQHVILFEMDNVGIRNRTEISLGDMNCALRVSTLSQWQVDTLLCGAISRPLHEMLINAGIQVIPFLAGDLDTVVAAFIQGNVNQMQYRMPGCCRRHKQWNGAWGRNRKGKQS